MKKYLKILNNQRGQSMVEFAVVLPVLVLFFYCFIYLSDLYTIKQNAVTAARYSAWQLARPDAPDCDDLQDDLSEFFFNGEDVTLDCDPSNGSTSGFMGNATAMTERVLTFILGGMSNDLYHAKVEYPVPVPDALASLDPTNTLSNITITGEHFVNANAWSGFEEDVHDIFDMIENLIMDFISFF